MFKKLISSLTFSPALMHQLGFYAKRLKHEEATRKLGLVFTALAVMVQSFSMIYTPEAANAANTNDFVYGGVQNKEEYLSNYDRNVNGLKDFFNAMGVTRDELNNTKEAKIDTRDKSVLSWGRESRISSQLGEKKYTIQKQDGGSMDFYSRPLWRLDSRSYSTYDVLVGYSEKVGWFAILKNCGNFATKSYPEIQTCPQNTTGVYPNCVQKECEEGQIGVYPNCSEPPKPVATCSELSVKSVEGVHTITSTANLENGAKVIAHNFTVKKDGKIVKEHNVKTDELTATWTYKNKTEGEYTVSVNLDTSEGAKTSEDCEKTITVVPPEVCQYNTKLLAEDKNCQPCEADETLWFKDESCAGAVVYTKTAENTTQKVDAKTSVANAGDRILYKVTATNDGNKATKADFNENLKDTLEYSKVIDDGGGKFNEETKTLVWSGVTLKPGESQTRMFSVQLLEKIPATPQGTSDPTSYDCKMTNTFGNTVNINVNCPAPKQVENTVTQLPKTGVSENTFFAVIILATATYFYARSRQMRKEVRLIRNNINTTSLHRS